MSQDINLLTVSTTAGERLPGAVQAAGLALAVVVLGVAASSWLTARVEAEQRRVVVASDAIDDLVWSLEERSQFLAQRNADPLLLAELGQREREAADKAQVLDLLSGETLGNTEGFSAHLAALGRRHPEGLWLQHIRVADGGRQMLLKGKARTAELVPRFLDGLRLESAFAGRAFETFALAGEADERAALTFALATACSDLGLDASAAPCGDDAGATP